MNTETALQAALQAATETLSRLEEKFELYTALERIAELKAKLELQVALKKISDLETKLERYRVDTVYGIFSRAALEDLWSDLKDDRSLAIAYVDLDDLHQANSKFGMEGVNDRVRQALSVLRKDEWTCGRFFSGDEFLIIAPKDEILIPCERLMKALENQGLSATVAIVPNDGSDTLAEAAKEASLLNQRGKLIEKGRIYCNID